MREVNQEQRSGVELAISGGGRWRGWGEEEMKLADMSDKL